MQLAEILARIEGRLKALEMSANRASQLSGRPDAIRNLRRAVKDGQREGVSTATLTALAPVLRTSPQWLLTGAENVGPEDVAVEALVNDSLAYADASTAMAWAFEALDLGTEAECRVLARIVLAAKNTRRSPLGEPLSDQEKRQLVSDAIRIFRIR